VNLGRISDSCLHSKTQLGIIGGQTVKIIFVAQK